MLKSRYRQAQTDHTLFIKKEGPKLTALIVYVDDIVVLGNNEVEVAQLKGSLAREFEIKDLGSLRYSLGIETAKAKQGISLSQRKYM